MFAAWFGWAPDSWAAIGTFAAVIVALVLPSRERHHDKKRDDHAEASRVGVWFQSPDTPPDNRRHWLLVAENLSATPLYDWEACAWWLGDDNPNDYRTVVMDQANLGPLPPSVRRVAHLDTHFGFPKDDTIRRLRVGMKWRDAQGRQWLRYGALLTGPFERDAEVAVPWSEVDRSAGQPSLDDLADRAMRSNKPRTRRWMPRRP